MQNPFFWGNNGQKLTPGQISRGRERAGALIEQALQGESKTFLGALNRGLQGFVGGRMRNRADEFENAGLSSADEFIQGNPVLSPMFGGDQASMQQPSPVTSALLDTPQETGPIVQPPAARLTPMGDIFGLRNIFGR